MFKLPTPPKFRCWMDCSPCSNFQLRRLGPQAKVTGELEVKAAKVGFFLDFVVI